ncbi:MAG: hypothetical protein ACTSRP_24670, partial [Candidatus Helarchaeota archaeon]
KNNSLFKFIESIKNKKFKINKNPESKLQIKNIISELNINESEKEQILNELLELPEFVRNSIILKIKDASTFRTENFQIDELIESFKRAEESNNIDEMLKYLELILELAMINDYFLIFNKLYNKYQHILFDSIKN